MPISPEYDHDHDECERHASEYVGPAVRQHLYPGVRQRLRADEQQRKQLLDNLRAALQELDNFDAQWGRLVRSIIGVGGALAAEQQRRRDRDPNPEGPLLPLASKRLHPQCPGCRC